VVEADEHHPACPSLCEIGTMLCSAHRSHDCACAELVEADEADRPKAAVVLASVRRDLDIMRIGFEGGGYVGPAGVLAEIIERIDASLRPLTEGEA
jgi:hypothetical protein